jgi:hypothetical protein
MPAVRHRAKAARNWAGIAIVFAALSCTGAAFAHHSNASYDRDHQTKLKGTVVDFKWTNPHIQILFDVKGRGGAPERWIGEGPSPSQMAENGWTEETLKPGDRISVVGNPPRSGAMSIRLRWVTLPNGKDLFAYKN